MHRRRSCTAWFAALAFVLASLAPALGEAFGIANGSVAWTEICTPLGAKWQRLDDSGADESSQPGAAAHAFEHCSYCGGHVALPGVPPLNEAPAPLDLAHEVPRAFLQAPVTPHAWVSAQPRAPPHS